MAELDLGRIRFFDKGEHSMETEYVLWDFVEGDGSTYLYTNKIGSTGKALTNSAYWKKLAAGLTEAEINAVLIATQEANTATTQANDARDRAIATTDETVIAKNATIQATEDASTAAGLANTATSNAIDATNDAIIATTNANEGAVYAQAQGDYAKAQGEAIQDDLALKANHGYGEGEEPKTLKQVDDNSAQLESDVSLLRDDATVKIENLVVNGDFRNGATGWTSSNSTIAVSNANLIITGTGAAAITTGISPAFSGVNSGDKIYVYSRMRALNSKLSLIRVRMANSGLSNIYGDAVISSPVENQWYPISGIISKEMVSSSYVILLQSEYPTTADALNSQHEVDNAMAINLTATFGAGNEPTNEEMDLLISTLGIDYFEGEITIPSQKLMQWQLKLIRKNKNAIIALGGTII